MRASTAYPVVDVTSWDLLSDETSGADEKLWLAEPATGLKWLFKAVTIKNGHRQGEDWAEKAVSELAGLIGLPCAQVQLAIRGEAEGTISLNLRPEAYDLQPGYVVMLAAGVPGFEPGNVKGRPGHSLPNIKNVLKGATQPPGAELPDWMEAWDVFSGYVMLDAWVANRDRHDENWSVLIPAAGESADRLCGSYDHAGSLGYNLRDDERERRLSGTGSDVQAWAKRGTAWRLEHPVGSSPMTLVEAADQAFELAGDRTRTHWLSLLTRVTAAEISDVLDRIPRMSEPSRRFAAEVLEINRRRILDECAKAS